MHSAAAEPSIDRISWQLLSLPPLAIEVHVEAYVGSYVAMSEQHADSVAHAPEDEALESPAPLSSAPLSSLPPVPHAEEQLCVTQVKTGPSHVAQLLVSH